MFVVDRFIGKLTNDRSCEWLDKSDPSICRDLPNKFCKCRAWFSGGPAEHVHAHRLAVVKTKPTS